MAHDMSFSSVTFQKCNLYAYLHKNNTHTLTELTIYMNNHKDITHRSQSLNSFTVTARNIKEFSLKLRDGGRKT